MIDEKFYEVAKKHLSDNEITKLYNQIKDIIEHAEFQKRKKYVHHDDSVFEHSICVCIRALKIANKLPFNFNYKSIAIGSVLHDFYYSPWQNKKQKTKFFKQHGFTHSLDALNNSCEHFNHLIDDISKDIIKKHMWPLTIRNMPHFRESWIVTTADKIESLKVLKNISKLPKYIGVK